MNWDLVKLIRWHINRYKIREIRDIYKLLYQGTLGNSHYAMVDSDKLEEWLREEIESVIDDYREPLLENISVDKKFVRINLRPFKWYNYSIDKLLLVMKDSAEKKIEKAAFIDVWQEFGRFVKENEFLYFNIENYYQFDEEMAKSDYPPVHHSEDYVRKNEPAYRVVNRELFLKSFSLNKD